MATSQFYQTLKSTAEKFIHSTEFSAPSNGLDKSAIRAICAENFKQSFGHDYLISTRPHLNQVMDFDGFIAHLERITPKLESAEADITDMTIDEFQRKVVVRATIRLTPKGSKEAGVNDLIWILKMNEQGDKVESGKEFIDGDASVRLGQLIKESSSQ